MKLQKGFTLIELMITVAIVVILAAIAYPSYMRYTIKSNRSAVESFMLQAANMEERVMLDLRGYVAVTANANFPNAPTGAAPGLNLALSGDVSNYYDITVAAVNAATPPSYLITATAKGTQLTNDAACSPLTLDQTGAKTPATGCW